MLGDSQADRDVLAVVAEAAAEIAADRTPQVRSQFATITSFGTADTETIPTCIVHFDGAPPGEQHEVVAALSGSPAPGDRVLILFLPPHGAVAVAALPSAAAGGSDCGLLVARYLWYDFAFSADNTWEGQFIDTLIDPAGIIDTTGQFPSVVVPVGGAVRFGAYGQWGTIGEGRDGPFGDVH